MAVKTHVIITNINRWEKIDRLLVFGHVRGGFIGYTIFFLRRYLLRKLEMSANYYVIEKGQYAGIWNDWNSIVAIQAAYPSTNYQAVYSRSKAEAISKTTEVRQPVTPSSIRKSARVGSLKKINTKRRAGRLRNRRSIGKAQRARVTRIRSRSRLSLRKLLRTDVRKRIQYYMGHTLVIDGVRPLKKNPHFGIGILRYDGEILSQIGYGAVAGRSDSNRRAKVLAMLYALQEAERLLAQTDKMVQIVFNYEILIDVLVNAPKQKRRGWKTIDKKPIEDKDIVNQIYKIFQRCGDRLIFSYNRKRDSIYVVDRANELAKMGRVNSAVGFKFRCVSCSRPQIDPSWNKLL